MASANLAAANGAAAPNQKEVAINDAVDALDNAINRAVLVVMADAALGLSASQGNRQGLIMLMGSLIVPRLVIPPVNGRRLPPRKATSGGHAVTVGYAVGGVTMPSAPTARPFWSASEPTSTASPAVEAAVALRRYVLSVFAPVTPAAGIADVGLSLPGVQLP